MENYHKLLEIQSRQKIISQHSGGLYRNLQGENQYSLQQIKGGWEPLEHQQMGYDIQLQVEENKFINGKEQIFKVCGSTDFQVSFSELLALAGEFYGGDKPISLPGGSDDDKTQRFQIAFDNLFKNPDALKELPKLLELIDHQLDQRVDYCEVTNGRYADLKFDCSDNYDDQARDAYIIGHKLAIKTAQKGTPEALNLAYSIEGFACHYLTKAFSASHTRNPRGQVELFVISTGFSQLKNHPLAKFMANNIAYMQHEEDGKMGIYFKNDSGDSWYGLGSNYYLDDKNDENYKMIKKTLQLSVDEIYLANKGQLKETIMNKMLPYADFDKCNIGLTFYQYNKLWIRCSVMDEHQKEYVRCFDMYQIAFATLEIANTGFYDVQVLEFFTDLYSPIDKAASGCCGTKQAKPKRNKTENRANWVTPKKKIGYADLEEKLFEYWEDPKKLIPFNKDKQEQEAKKKQLQKANFEKNKTKIIPKQQQQQTEEGNV